MSDVPKEAAIWTHTEHMAWGRKMFVNGLTMGLAISALGYSLMVLLK